MKKKALSLLLAGAMVLSMSIPSLATQMTAGGTVSTELVGTIKATQLVVTVPTAVFFVVDPTEKHTDDNGNELPTNQVTMPMDENGNQVKFVIQNSSVVPVYVNIKSVSASRVELVNAPSLLQDRQKKRMMFALGETGTTKRYNTPTDWLLSTTTDYPLNSSTGGRIESVTRTNGEETPGEMELTIFARADLGWEDGDVFTVTPTFVVTVMEPSQAGNTSEQESIAQNVQGESIAIPGTAIDETIADISGNETVLAEGNSE